MKPKIDFYVLLDNDEKIRLKFVCRLIEKEFKNQHRIYVHTNNQADAFQLDELLWTYREDSFLPHNLVGDGPAPPPPIQIGFNGLPEKQRDILINFNQTVPDFYPQFSRVLELVSSDPKIQATAREHYRLYRSHGHEITTHKLQHTET